MEQHDFDEMIKQWTAVSLSNDADVGYKIKLKEILRDWFAKSCEDKRKLTVELDRYKGMEQNHKQEVHVLAQKLRTAELTIEHCDSENEQLNKKMCDDRAALNDRIMEFQRKNAALEGKIIQQETDLVAQRDIETGLRNELQQLVANRDVDTANSRLSDDSLESSRMHEQKTIANLTAELDILKNERHDLIEQVQAQLQQLELTKRALDDATSHNVELQSLCDQYQRDAKEAKNRLIELNGEIECARVAQKTSRKGNSVFSEFVDERVILEKDLVSIKNEVDMLKVQNQQLKRELEAQKRQLLFAYQVNNEKSNSDAQLELTKLRGEIRLLQARLSQRPSAIGCNDERANIVLADSERITRDMISSLRKENARLKTSLDQRIVESESLEDRIIAERNERRKIETQLVQLRHEYDMVRNKNAADKVVQSQIPITDHQPIGVKSNRRVEIIVSRDGADRR